MKFKEWNCGDYIVYDIRFFYGSFPLFNPKILLKDSINFEEYGKDTLIPVLEKALKTNASDDWHSLEYEFEILIQALPKMGLTDALQNKNLIFVSEDEKERLRKVDEEKKKNNGLLPKDTFSLYFFFNSANLMQISKEKDERSEWNIGPGLQLLVDRPTLEKFVGDLKNEYKKFKRNKH